MDLKEIRKHLEDELNEVGGDITSTGMNSSKRLTRAHGRQYAFQGPGITRITRKDKRDLLKEKDISKVMPVLENSFAMMIAAVQGTELEQFAISRLNMLRQQLQKKANQIKK